MAGIDSVLAELSARAAEPARVFGLRGGAAAYLLARQVATAVRPVVVVAASAKEASRWLADLRFFLPESVALHAYPAWDVAPLSGVSPTAEVLAERLLALAALGAGEACVVVAVAEALAQRVPSPERVASTSRELVVEADFGFENLVELLASGGYRRVPQVEDRGEFSVRGEIVDLHPAGRVRPLRVHFDGDRVERLREFDPGSQRSLDAVSSARITPWREISPDRWQSREALRAVEAHAQELALPRKDRIAILARMEAGLAFPGGESLAPIVLGDLLTFGDHCPPDTVFWIDQAPAVEAAEDAFALSVERHAAEAAELHRLVPDAAALYLEPEAARRDRARFGEVEVDRLEWFGNEPPPGVMQVQSYTTTGFGLAADAAAGPASVDPLVAEWTRWARAEHRVYLVVHDEAEAKRLKGLLEGRDVHLPILEGTWAEAAARAERAILIGDLRSGFRLQEDGLVVVAGEELFGERRRRAGSPNVKSLLASLSEIQEGDIVVHVEHGVARYRGLQHMTVADTEGDYLLLEYGAGDRLYVPVHGIGAVDKFVGGDGVEPELDRLGSGSWEKVKARARESVLSMARELVKTHAVREVLEGYAFAPPDADLRDFEARFPFEETPDQRRAIDDVLEDLQRPRPMDRLVCGDVGFGKTEVALRAAFHVAMEGRQVLVLVPTTVLARQHAETFKKRFAGLPVRVEQLSRFQKPGESTEVIKGIASGDVDIVIGTHRLLRPEVKPKDLGLVVIDEEHRFGVAHKERLKQLRELVDVLTLTATPIPRTLQMAVSGIRELSVIETPPLDRQAIRTYVVRRDDALVREAVMREVGRGGQVFYVDNRVQAMERTAAHLAEILPEIRLGIAHGQMGATALEKVMLRFLEGEIDLLLTSSIIESGLDIPNANTILIDRADRFGLSQLYQMRGRVGRSTHRAYAYLMIPGEALITDDAQKRLAALASLDDLGGGFRLAMRDLEIRGAGNLLGKKQAGHVAAVGFDLFTKMLEDAIHEIRGEDRQVEIEPEIQLGVAAFLPEEYIGDISQRMRIYKRLARAADATEMAEIGEELQDRYGPPPARVRDLVELMDLRRHLKRYLVTRIRRQGAALAMSFHEKSPIATPDLRRRARAQGFQIIGPELHVACSRIDVGGIGEAALQALDALAPVASGETHRS